jgi:hypothetical protein
MWLPKQAESRGLSAFNRLRMKSCSAEVRVRAGPFLQNAAPCEHVADARKQSASSAPLILRGVAGCPRSKGSGETACGLASRGRLSPHESNFEGIERLALDAKTRVWRTRLDSNQRPTPSEGVTLSS